MAFDRYSANTAEWKLNASFTVRSARTRYAPVLRRCPGRLGVRRNKAYIIALIIAALIVALAKMHRRGGSTVARWLPAIHGH
jgi:hypothetical protein